MMDATTVAECILNELGSLSTMKLQKLVFYSQAFHLVRTGRPLFADKIQAWANGPVVYTLFDRHRGKFVVHRGFLGDRRISSLQPEDAYSIRHVIERVGGKTGAELSELTHGELPWINARGDVSPSQRSQAIIDEKSIIAFYGSPECTNPVFLR